MTQPQPTPSPECARLRRAIARVLAVIRRKAGGAMAEIRSVLEEAMRGP